MPKTRFGIALAALLTTGLMVSACSNSRNDEGDAPVPTGTPTPPPDASPTPIPSPTPTPTPVPTAPPGLELYGLTTDNRILTFDANDARNPITSFPITGLAENEAGVGIDVRPADNRLYLLTNQSRLYTLDHLTGAATLASTLSLPLDPEATGVGMDFNPVPDRLRIVTNTGQNLRVNVDTGEVAVDLDRNGDIGLTLNGLPAGATAAAYTNSLPGAGTTALYVIDTNVNPPRLLLVPSPNTGVMQVVGSLGAAALGATAVNGFDIDGRNGQALASLFIGEQTQLFSINLDTGLASSLGALNTGAPLVGLARSTPTVEVLAVRGADQLIRFRPATPGTVDVLGTVGSLNGGERVVGLDARSAANDRNVYALTNAGRLLRLLNPDNDATAGPVPFATAVTSDARRVGFDFNPAANALRIVGEATENRRIPPALNANALVDGSLGYLMAGSIGGVVGLAHTNPGGAGQTTVFAIDGVNNRLLRLGGDVSDDGGCFGFVDGTPPPRNPDCGALTAIGSLGVNATAVGGYDIVDRVRGQTGNRHFALLNTTVSSMSGFRLHEINPSTGEATVIGTGAPRVDGSYFGLVALPSEAANAPLRFLALRRGTQANRDQLVEIVASTNLLGITSVSVENERPIDGMPQVGNPPRPVRLVALDERRTAAGDQLFALAEDGGVYRLAVTGGTVTASALVDAFGTPVFLALTGSAFAIDVNPRTDRLRVVSNGGSNIQVNMDTGVFSSNADLRLRSAPLPQAVATAYTNAFPGASSSVQYLIDARDSSLAIVRPPNDGIVRRVAPLFGAAPLLPPSSPEAVMFPQAFDIAGGNNGLALAALLRSGETASTLYRIALVGEAGTTEPVATAVGPIGGMDSAPVAALAIRVLDRPPPVAATPTPSPTPTPAP